MPAPSSIKIGSLMVPIIAEVELSGTTAGASPNVTSALDNAEKWRMCTVIGTGANNYENSGSISVSPVIQNGTTSCHGMNVVVDSPRETADFTFKALLHREIVSSGLAYGTDYDIPVISEPDYLLSSGHLRKNGMYAIAYHYPNATNENERVYGYRVFVMQNDYKTDTNQSYNQIGYFWLDFPYYNKALYTMFYYDGTEPEPPSPDPDDPNSEDDPSGPDGGDGDHTPIYDPVPIPNAPSLGAANAGFVTMYKLGLAAINQFAGDMFASTIWEAIKLYFSNPIDFLVGCMLLPFEPHTGSSYKPKFGAVSFAHAYPAVDEQYKDIDCGVVQINKYWGSCFDYEPYTKIQIWLPYIGYRDLPVDEIMGMSLGVKYRVDCLTGDCVAFVSTGVNGAQGPEIPRVIAQFYGNCGVRVPFGSVSFDSAVAASINLMGAAASMGLSAGSGSVQVGSEGGTSVDEGFSSPSGAGLVNAGIGLVNGIKPNVQKGGAAGASSGYMSVQKPYLIRRIPRQNLPADYMKLKGYPSNISGKLADFTGVAVVDNIQLNNIPAMENERREIMQWLTGGVII